MINKTVSDEAIRTEVENLLIMSYLREELHNKILYLVLKRLIDILMSMMLILFLSPLMLMISISILFSRGHGIIFSQSRFGKNKQRFNFYKFRSMDDCRKYLSYCFIDKNGNLNKTKNDPRITKIGRIIRRTSLDELPQLFNILKGDMSFIGPRPIVEEMLENHQTINKLRTLVKPGLTGLWQVSNRQNHSSVKDMIDYDLHYIRNCSIKLDLIILLKTIPAVISCRGAV